MRIQPARLVVAVTSAIACLAVLPLLVLAECDGEGCRDAEPAGEPLGAVVLFALVVVGAFAMAVSEARRRP